jgi:hypothetical protein
MTGGDKYILDNITAASYAHLVCAGIDYDAKTYSAFVSGPFVA